MTSDQKAKAYLLEILHACAGVPRPIEYLATELGLVAGRHVATRELIDQMVEDGLAEMSKDGLGIKRWAITAKGRAAWESL